MRRVGGNGYLGGAPPYNFIDDTATSTTDKDSNASPELEKTSRVRVRNKTARNIYIGIIVLLVLVVITFTVIDVLATKSPDNGTLLIVRAVLQGVIILMTAVATVSSVMNYLQFRAYEVETKETKYLYGPGSSSSVHSSVPAYVPTKKSVSWQQSEMQPVSQPEMQQPEMQQQEESTQQTGETTSTSSTNAFYATPATPATSATGETATSTATDYFKQIEDGEASDTSMNNNPVRKQSLVRKPVVTVSRAPIGSQSL
jgi:hypothetical protein